MSLIGETTRAGHARTPAEPRYRVESPYPPNCWTVIDSSLPVPQGPPWRLCPLTTKARAEATAAYLNLTSEPVSYEGLIDYLGGEQTPATLPVRYIRHLILAEATPVLYRIAARGWHFAPTRARDHAGRLCCLWVLRRD